MARDSSRVTHKSEGVLGIGTGPLRSVTDVGKGMLEIWHNPRCSKSRQTLAIIEEAGAEVRVRRYIDDVPSMTELNRVLRALEVEPTALVRIGEPVAKQLKLKSRELSRSEWLTVLVAHPILIERPIVIRDDGRAIVGRPPENVRDLL